MRLYAVQSQNIELETYAAEIKLRAQRRIGEISGGIEKKAGRPTILPTTGKNLSKAQTLRSAGISQSPANRCEQIAKIPEAEFEAVIAQ